MISSGKLLRRTRWLLLSVCIVIALAGVASAYTVVMRSGRRVEVRPNFTVTETTLTYEVSPEMQVTILLNAIDIRATERANNEPAGSLLKRASLSPQMPTQPGEVPARENSKSRTITNRELEVYRQARRESELSYERRRKELGLPSQEESRRKAAEEAESLNARSEQGLAEEREAESYWRGRADALRTELAAVDAEINFVRTGLNEIPFATGIHSFPIFTSGLPFGSIGHSPFPGFRPGRVPRPNIIVAPGRRAQINGRINIGGGRTRGGVFINRRPTYHPGRHHQFLTPQLGWPNAVVFGSPYLSQDYSYERETLVVQLNELLRARAGLNARWQLLEDEARQAGAAPGWLRP